MVAALRQAHFSASADASVAWEICCSLLRSCPLSLGRRPSAKVQHAEERREGERGHQGLRINSLLEPRANRWR